MDTHPIPSFPLLASDQADVIRIFLELMRNGDRIGHASEVTVNKPLELRNDSGHSWFPGELPELDQRE